MATKKLTQNKIDAVLAEYVATYQALCQVTHETLMRRAAEELGVSCDEIEEEWNALT